MGTQDFDGGQGGVQAFLTKVQDFRSLTKAADTFLDVFCMFRSIQAETRQELLNDADRLASSYEDLNYLDAQQVASFGMLTEDFLSKEPADRDEATLDIFQTLFGADPSEEEVMDKILSFYSRENLDPLALHKIRAFVVTPTNSELADIRADIAESFAIRQVASGSGKSADLHAKLMLTSSSAISAETRNNLNHQISYGEIIDD